MADAIGDAVIDTDGDAEMGADSECSGDSLADGSDDMLTLDDPERLSRGIADVDALG